MTRGIKTSIHVCVAALAFLGAYEIAYWLSPDWWLYSRNLVAPLTLAGLYGGMAATVELAFGIERTSWRFLSLRDAVLIARSATVTALGFLALAFVVARAEGLPRSTFVLAWLFQLVGLAAVRVIWRARFDASLLRALVSRRQTFRAPPGGKRLLVVGPAARADAFLRDLEVDPKAAHSPVGVVSPLPSEVGHIIRAVPVLGATEQLQAILNDLEARRRAPEALLFLCEPLELPGVSVEQLGRLSQAGVKLLRRPSVSEVSAYTTAAAVKEITLEELLSRPAIVLDQEPVRRLLSGKSVLVTGAGGSIGSEICRQVAALGCARLVMLDSSEAGLFSISSEVVERFPALPNAVALCNIRERDRVLACFEAERPEIVFHAAALKHVPMLESHPCEAVLTNICGTENLIAAAQALRTQEFVLISTDKAVNPSSVMGATKRIAEALARANAIFSPTRFSVVRFGNVLGSSGSVVPTFRSQIERGGPVTVTHEHIERFFMTIPEAVQLVLSASATAAEVEQPRGRLFVLEMGRPVKIIDLARQMIELMGKRPHVDVEIKVIGLRPGEKVREELVDVGEIAVDHKNSVLEVVNNTDHERFSSVWVRELENAAMVGDAGLVRRILFSAVGDLREDLAIAV